MALSSQEMILALRAPNAHWLAALVNALDEALLDPDFGAQQRAIVCQLLQSGIVPHGVARAADARFAQFEQSFGDVEAAEVDETAPTASPANPGRPKLTLVGNAAA
ncbi:hypothetical protein [Tahibacter soli]|uniref:Uncharacterized protein n=1 Tax=Tahibacter soli TaxID=2983605 RepID=A0A9X3YJV2_9GAMM|nr:hypothetical protein [Tahibacter soli]MDC8012033.1 hypothetical protein [Tahibacter soli]